MNKFIRTYESYTKNSKLETLNETVEEKSECKCDGDCGDDCNCDAGCKCKEDEKVEEAVVNESEADTEDQVEEPSEEKVEEVDGKEETNEAVVNEGVAPQWFTEWLISKGWANEYMSNFDKLDPQNITTESLKLLFPLPKVALKWLLDMGVYEGIFKKVGDIYQLDEENK